VTIRLVKELLANPKVEHVFGRFSSGFALELKRAHPEKYVALKALARRLGLIGSEPIAEPSDWGETFNRNSSNPLHSAIAGCRGTLFARDHLKSILTQSTAILERFPTSSTTSNKDSCGADAAPALKVMPPPRRKGIPGGCQCENFILHSVRVVFTSATWLIPDLGDEARYPRGMAWKVLPPPEIFSKNLTVERTNKLTPPERRGAV